MNGVTRLLIGLTMFSMVGLLAACASVQPSTPVRVELSKEETAAKSGGKGTTVYLYYGKNEKAKEEFCVGTIVPVHRLVGGWGEAPVNKVLVGKIKVTKDLGAYVEAVVVEGTMLAGDIAGLENGNTECIILTK